MPLLASTPAPAVVARTAYSIYPRAASYFAFVLLVTIAGFFPSYFARLGHASPVYHFHGLTALSWMLLLITQAHLANTRRLNLHRRLGRFSMVLMPAFVISGFLVINVMLEARNPFNQTFGARLAWIDITTLIYFAAAYVLALIHRRNQPLHARWLASTAVVVLPPGLARFVGNCIPGIASFEMAIYVTYAICGLATLGLLWDDTKKGGIRAPYVALAVTLAAHVIGFVLVPEWSWWNELTRSFAVK